MTYATDDWSYENSYNEVKVKELVKWIDDENRLIERWEILEKSRLLFIKERTLSDILKKLVFSKKIKRLSHGLYSSLNYKPSEMIEQRIQQKRIKQLESEGYYVIKLIKTNKNGIPDLIAVHPDGKILFSEIKKEGGRLSSLQEYRLKELKTFGFKTEVYTG